MTNIEYGNALLEIYRAEIAFAKKNFGKSNDIYRSFVLSANRYALEISKLYKPNIITEEDLKYYNEVYSIEHCLIYLESQTYD